MAVHVVRTLVLGKPFGSVGQGRPWVGGLGLRKTWKDNSLRFNKGFFVRTSSTQLARPESGGTFDHHSCFQATTV